MKHILPIFVFAAMLFTGCEQNAPTTYDKVAGHTYVRQYDQYNHDTDTIIFYNDGSLKIKHISNATNYEQVDNIVIVYGSNLRIFYEAFNKRIVNWAGKGYYDRID